MRLDYSIGTVSFCPDLTARQVQSVPLGLLLVGNLVSDDKLECGLAALYVPHFEVEPRPDPMTYEVLLSVADLLRSHISEVVSSDPTAPPVAIVRALHDKLRNSLYVSSISDERSVNIDGSYVATLEVILDEAFARAVDDSGLRIERDGTRQMPSRIPDLQQIQRFERPGAQSARC